MIEYLLLAFPAPPSFWTLPRIPLAETDGTMALAPLPKCPFCKRSDATEVYSRYVYPQNPAVWPGKAIGIHKIYLCHCGQKFTKINKRRRDMKLAESSGAPEPNVRLAEPPEGSNGQPKSKENGSAKPHKDRTQQKDE